MGDGSRLDAVDMLRGAAMVVMALDHVRDFFGDLGFDPLDLSATTPAYYLTRWITHFAAPIFFFLAGTGAYLQLARGKTKRDLSRFLWTRGLWLVILEFTIVDLAWSGNLLDPGRRMMVIWALGVSMIVLAALVWLDLKWIALFGVGMIVLHDAFDRVSPDAFGPFASLWSILHASAEISPVPDRFYVFVLYPLVPWIGVMAAGFAFGKVLTLDERERRTWLVRLGAGALAAFFVLRLANVYGDPAPWSVQKDTATTLLSFFNVEKYPASLDFLLATLGPALLALAAFERVRGFPRDFLVVFGRAPLFYYVLHLYLIHALVIVATAITGHDARAFYGNTFVPIVVQWELPVVYLVWIGVVLVLWPACRWFADVKKRHRDKAWLSYF